MKRVIVASSRNEKLTDDQLWDILSEALWGTGLAASHMNGHGNNIWTFQDKAGDVYIRLSDADVRNIVSYEQYASEGDKKKFKENILNELMRYDTKKSNVSSSSIVMASKNFSVEEFKNQLINQKPKKATVPAEYEEEIREMLNDLSENNFPHLAWGYDKRGKNLKFKFNYNEDVQSTTVMSAKDKFDIKKLEKDLESQPETITVPGKYFDQVCELLDSKDIDYAYGAYKKGKEYKFKLIYEYDEEDYE